MKLHELKENEVIEKPPVQKKEIELNKPGGFNVCVLNDPVTPGMLVIDAIVHCVKISPQEAMRRVMHAHKNGWAVVATYASRDLAETVASSIEAYVRNDTKYDKYHEYTGHPGPWPLAVEVMEAGG
jgi:ATP-dependent Clp protease adapter protein ClpS